LRINRKGGLDSATPTVIFEEQEDSEINYSE